MKPKLAAILAALFIAASFAHAQTQHDRVSLSPGLSVLQQYAASGTVTGWQIVTDSRYFWHIQRKPKRAHSQQQSRTSTEV